MQALADGADVVAGQRRLFVAVAHPEATTEVQVANADAFAGQAVDQPEQALEGVEEGLQLGQLRADVAVDADHLQVVKLGGAGVDRLGLVDGDAELVLFQAGGDIGVGLGVHVRVDPQRYRRFHAEFRSYPLQALQLFAGLDVEAVHADFQGAAHVVAGLADAGEHHLGRIAAGGQDTLQLTAGNDVETGAEARQHIQHPEVGVGLDREADQMRHAGEGIGIGAVLGLDVCAGIDVGGRAETLGDAGKRHPFREQLTVAVTECVHGRSLRNRSGLCCVLSWLFRRPAGTAGLSGRRRRWSRRGGRARRRTGTAAS